MKRTNPCSESVQCPYWQTLLALFLALASSDGLSSTQDEITHLLEYLEHSPCLYERNGEKHNGEEAVKHIQRKYAYYEDDIETTADFIEYSASKSQFSGRLYLIHCPGDPVIPSRQWLLTELQRYRSKGAD